MKETKKIFEGSFSELDADLQKYLTVKAIYCTGFLLFTIAIGLIYKSFSLFFILLTAVLLYSGLCYYELTLCLSNKLASIEGQVNNVYKRHAVKNLVGFERNFIMLKQDDVYIKIYKEKVDAYKEGNMLKVFVRPSSIRQINQDTFECTSVFHVIKIKEN